MYLNASDRFARLKLAMSLMPANRGVSVLDQYSIYIDYLGVSDIQKFDIKFIDFKTCTYICIYCQTVIAAQSYD